MKPMHVASIVTLIYWIPSLLYIYFSSHITEALAVTAEEAAFVEIIKGVVYVTLAALVVFVASLKTVTLYRDQRQINQRIRDSLLEAERRATAGLFAATCAHDMRNELAVLKSNNQLLERRDDLAEITTDIVADQQQAIERLIELSTRLTNAGKAENEAEPEESDVVELVTTVLKSLRGHSSLRDCDVRLDTDLQSVHRRAYPKLMYQMLINLLFNAADAVDGKGQIEIRLVAQEEFLVVEVHDDGPGVPDEEIDQLFEPFYSTKFEGTGLGLVSVRTCAVAHGGEVEVDSSELGGACFRVRIDEAPSHEHSLAWLVNDVDATPSDHGLKSETVE